MLEQQVSGFHISSLGSFAPAEKGQMRRRIAMAWYDDGANLAWPNVLRIAGAAVLAPVLLPAVSFVVRPVVKSVVKAGLAVKDMAMGLGADAGEQVSDLYAEAKAEHCAKPEAVNLGTGALTS